MKRPAGEYEETYNLAARFLRVFQILTYLTQQETPDATTDALNVNQLRALGVIYNKPGITQKELAQALDITAASVSISVGKLVDLDLVEKQADPDDGRVLRLYLGPQGQRMIKHIEAERTNMIADLLGNLPIDEQQVVVEALERALVAREQRLQVEQ
ncbi:MAG: hypothetical protein Phog2KO_50090 [Phototrophicaceae bacterium]